MVRVSICPAPGEGIGLSTILKSSSCGNAVAGSRASVHWRFIARAPRLGHC